MIDGVTEAGLRPGQRLRSPTARSGLAALDACDTTRLYQYVRIRSVDISPADHMMLILDNGDRARLPREHLEAKLKRLATILKTIRDQQLPRGAGPIEIDLTTEDVFPVRGLDVEALNAARTRR
jgi:cell division septal protein FtsQ